MQKELWATIHSAVILSEEISKSRAMLHFGKFTEGNGGRGEYGFPFSEVVLESEEGLEVGYPGMMVELMVAPFFTKAGNADGEEYETETYLVKESVVCVETRRALEQILSHHFVTQLGSACQLGMGSSQSRAYE